MELPERITEARRGRSMGKIWGPFSKKHHFCQMLIWLLAGIDNKRPLRFDIVIGKNLHCVFNENHHLLGLPLWSNENRGEAGTWTLPGLSVELEKCQSMGRHQWNRGGMPEIFGSYMSLLCIKPMPNLISTLISWSNLWIPSKNPRSGNQEDDTGVERYFPIYFIWDVLL